MEWFSIWWDGLALIEQTLYCIALPSTLFLVIQAILIVFGAAGHMDGSGGMDGMDGMDGDGFGDFDGHDGHDGYDGHGHDIDIGGDFSVLSMFTLQGIAAFLCTFGWGALFIYRIGNRTESSLPLFFVLLIAFVLGLAVMYAIARLMFYITKLAQSGTLEVRNLLGSSGTVYLNIPPRGEGKGKVTIQTSERFVEFDAVSEGEPIPNNAQIRVIDILGENVLVVEQLLAAEQL